MAETLPQIKISSAGSKPTSPIKSHTMNLSDQSSNHFAQGKITQTAIYLHTKILPGRVGLNESTQNLRGSQISINNANGFVAGPDESNAQQNAIDPLSQVHLKFREAQGSPRNWQYLISSTSSSAPILLQIPKIQYRRGGAIMVHLTGSLEHQKPVYRQAELRQSRQLHEQMVWLRRQPGTGSKALYFSCLLPIFQSIYRIPNWLVHSIQEKGFIS